jgi:PEP-CTERM motif
MENVCEKTRARSVRTRASLMAAATFAIAGFAAYPSASDAATIASVYTGGAGSYTLTGTVTSILSSNATIDTYTIADGTGSILDYRLLKTVYTPTVGDNITIAGTNSPYQDAPEFASVTSVTLNSTGNATSPTLVTIPVFNAAGVLLPSPTAVPPLAESIVTLDNVYLASPITALATFGTYTLTDTPPIVGGGNTATMYTYTSDTAVAAAVTAANAAEVTSGDTLYSGPLDITGYVDVFNGVPELYPTAIVAGVVPEPASLGLLAIGALGLMSRRRSKTV